MIQLHFTQAHIAPMVKDSSLSAQVVAMWPSLTTATQCTNLDFSPAHTVSTRNFKKPPGARPIGVSFRPGGAGRSDAAGDVR